MGMLFQGMKLCVVELISIPFLRKGIYAVGCFMSIIINEPYTGEALKDKLKGLRSFHVKRFRIISQVAGKKEIKLVALGPRACIYEETYRLIKKEEKLLRKAYSICDKWWFDKLDCRESFARQRVDNISFEEAMSHFVEKSLMRIIHHRAVIPLDGKPFLQVRFRSMEDPVDYFLWIIVDLKHKREFIEGLDEL